MKVVINGQRPLSLVEDEAFKQMVSYLELGYKFPSRFFFTGMLQEKYNALLEKIATIVADVDFVCITTDTWTSLATDSYLTATVHYVSDDWVLKSIILGTMFLDDRHTGENLSQWILELITKFGINPEKVVAVVHDNASNMLVAASKLKSLHGWESVRCSAHTLQLVVHAALSSNVKVQAALTKAKKLIEHFRRSTVAKQALVEQQERMEKEPLQLIQDVPTRWSSTFQMCKRLLQLRLPVTIVMANHELFDKQKRSQLEVSTENWTIFETLCELLELFAVLTKYLEGQSYVSMSAVQPLIKGILGAMSTSDDDDFASQFKSVAVQELQTRFQDLICPLTSTAIPIGIKATSFDIRFHKLKSLCSGQPREVRSSIEAELLAMGNQNPPESTVAQQPQSAETADNGNSSIASLLRYLDEDNETDMPVISDPEELTPCAIRRQLAVFASEPQKAFDSNPLSWWKEHEHRFKSLSRLAKKYLAIPATSAPSEHVFSLAGNTCNRRRASLSPKNLDALVFLNGNRHLMNDA